MKIRSHTFRGKRWLIRFVEKADEWGSCEEPTGVDKTMFLSPKLKRLDALDTTIHESLHACFWDIDEEVVEKAASDIARFLWRLGYRRCDT